MYCKSGPGYGFVKVTSFPLIISLCSDAVPVSGDSVSPAVLVVEKVNHHSIALSWGKAQEDRSGPTERWTRFAVEQMDPKTHTYGTIYM